MYERHETQSSIINVFVKVFHCLYRPLSVTYLQLNTATDIKFTKRFLTDFGFSLLQKWEYQNEKKKIKRQLWQN